MIVLRLVTLKYHFISLDHLYSCCVGLVSLKGWNVPWPFMCVYGHWSNGVWSPCKIQIPTRTMAAVGDAKYQAWSPWLSPPSEPFSPLQLVFPWAFSQPAKQVGCKVSLLSFVATCGCSSSSQVVVATEHYVMASSGMDLDLTLSHTHTHPSHTSDRSHVPWQHWVVLLEDHLRSYYVIPPPLT